MRDGESVSDHAKRVAASKDVTGKRPAAPTPHDAVVKLVSHTAGAQDAMMQLTYGDSLGWAAGAPLSAQDLDLVVVNAHDVLQVLVAMVIDLTAQENEDTSRDKLTLFRAVTEGVSLTEGMETLAQTMARRLRHFHQLRDGEKPGTGRVH